jgi:hypothetical protein
MDFTLTINGSSSEIARVLATLSDAPAPAMPPIAIIPAPFTMPSTPPLVSISPDLSQVVPVSAVEVPEFDRDGLPWDERIHAKTKVLVADGTWRKRRGVEDAVVAAVEMQLRGTPVAEMPPVAPPAPVAEMPPVAPPAPVAEMPPVAPPAPVATVGLDLSQFMQHMTGQMAKPGLVTTDYLTALTTEISNAFINAGHITAPLGAITDIGTNQSMLDYAVQLMQRDGKW